MQCLSVFDVSGIQDYMFRSSKLKENIGASLLVEEALNTHLKKVMNDVIATRHSGKYCETAWEGKREFAMLNPANNLAAEMIYCGGGNAMIACVDRPTAVAVAEELSWLLLEKSPNLQFSATHVEKDFTNPGNFCEDRKALLKVLLPAAKQNTTRSTPLLGMSITRECPQTGLPATYEDKKGEWVSSEIFFKRERAEQKHAFEDLIPKEKRSEYTFPLEIDELGQITGESHLAVIHIDGNNMGKKLDDLLSPLKDYAQAVDVMRQWSAQVSQVYKDTLSEVVKILLNPYAEYRTTGKFEFNYNSETRQAYLPLRPLVCNGDDVTLVTDGRLGISVAETFLKILSGKTLSINGQTYPLSACAGVAIVKSRFPFFRAYELAEQLCGSAKQKAKCLVSDEKAPVGNWLDFHIVFSGITSDLNTLRSKQYRIPGMEIPNPIVSLKYPDMKHARHNLCWRPWKVGANTLNDPNSWDVLKEMYMELTSKWPRSKLKDLRNAFISGEPAVKTLLKEAVSRDQKRAFQKRHNVNPDTGFDAEGMTPYFDALELLDFFIDINKEVI